MNCSQIKQKIPEWLDGELETAEAGIILAHLDGCAGCRSEVAFWQEIGTTLREDLVELKAPPGFTTEVMTQLAGQQRTGFSRFIEGWKRNLVVAATFLLVAVGSAGAYLQMNGNIAGHLASSGDTRLGHMAGKETKPGNNVNKPEIAIVDPKDGVDKAGPGNKPHNSKPEEKDPGPAVVNQKLDGNTGASDTAPVSMPTSEQYALLSIDKNRVIERTLLKVNVEDLSAAHRQALSFISGFHAQYEVLGSESTPEGGGQETLKIVVDSNLASQLLAELKTLGQVITTETQRDDVNSRYNEKVEQYRLLEAQAQAAQTAEEKNQLQVKMTGIEAQLKAWDREANTATIILWLEN